MKHPVFILSLYDTGYYIARLLKKTGITIYGFDHDPNNPGFYSKYIKATLVPHPQDDAVKLLNILRKKRNEFSLKPVLIASSENYLEFIHCKRTELENDFLFHLPAKEVLEKIINKSGQFEMALNCGINVPVYKAISSTKELEHESEVIEYPVVIKGVDQPIWKKNIKRKAFVAKSKKELIMIGKNLLNQNITFIVQKIIEGDCKNNYEFNALVANGKIIEHNMNQKIRQYPLEFGTSCCLQTVMNAEVEQLANKYLLQNGIEGFSNTEFKLDQGTGKYYFIEINARVWQQIELTRKIGQNYVLSYYNQLTNSESQSEFETNPLKLRWVDFPTDLLVFLRFRRQLGLSLTQFIKSTIMASNLGLLSIWDIKPFLKSVHIIK